MGYDGANQCAKRDAQKDKVSEQKKQQFAQEANNDRAKMAQAIRSGNFKRTYEKTSDNRNDDSGYRRSGKILIPRP